MIVYHGSTSWKIHSLAFGKSNSWLGLWITDTPERAQLYADAQASEIVSTELRFFEDSAVAELETTEVKWYHRSEDHSSLDKCEATIEAWKVRRVTVRMREYDMQHAKVKIDGDYVLILENLQRVFGDKLEIIIC
jgi:hypothetical protein